MSLGDPDQEPLRAWAATGYIPVMCRRNAEGGFSWQPVAPVYA